MTIPAINLIIFCGTFYLPLAYIPNSVAFGTFPKVFRVIDILKAVHISRQVVFIRVVDKEIIIIKPDNKDIMARYGFRLVIWIPHRYHDREPVLQVCGYFISRYISVKINNASLIQAVDSIDKDISPFRSRDTGTRVASSVELLDIEVFADVMIKAVLRLFILRGVQNRVKGAECNIKARSHARYLAGVIRVNFVVYLAVKVRTVLT
jgi:hypothetical protein